MNIRNFYLVLSFLFISVCKFVDSKQLKQETLTTTLTTTPTTTTLTTTTPTTTTPTTTTPTTKKVYDPFAEEYDYEDYYDNNKIEENDKDKVPEKISSSKKQHEDFKKFNKTSTYEYNKLNNTSSNELNSSTELYLNDFTNEIIALDDHRKKNDETNVINSKESSEGCIDDYFIDMMLENLFNENSTDEIRVHNINDTIKHIKNLIGFSKKVSDKFLPFIKSMGIILVEFISSSNISSDCLASLITILTGMKDNQFWALKYFDSFGRLPSAMLEGTIADLGDYDECIGISQSSENNHEENNRVIEGKFCLAKITMPLPQDLPNIKKLDFERLLSENMNQDHLLSSYDTLFIELFIKALILRNGELFRVGVCMPALCSGKEIENVINKMIFPLSSISIDFEPECDNGNNLKNINSNQIFPITLILLLILLVIVCTIVDKVTKARKSPMRKLLIFRLICSFSSKKNLKKLSEPLSLGSSLECLTFIKLICTIIIYWSHSYLISLSAVYGIKKILFGLPIKYFNSNKYMLGRNFNIYDTLFFVSGIILSYDLLNKFKKSKGRFNYFNYFIKQYFIYAPFMLGSILITFLLPLIGSGPIWSEGVKIYSQPCKDNWINNVLMINNFKLEKSCNVLSWFLATDFQLSLIAPILTLVIYHLNIIGICLTIFVMMLGCFLSIMPKLIWGLETFFEIQDVYSTIINSIEHYLTSPLQHLNVFAFGILLGYLIFSQTKFKINKIFKSILWLICPLMSILSLLWSKDWFNLEYYPDEIQIYLYFAFAKLVWSLGFAWIIFACCSGNAEFLNNFFKKTFFKYKFTHFNRIFLGISLYQINPFVYRAFTVRQTINITDYNIVSGFLFDFNITLILSYSMYFLLDGPANNIINLLLSKKKIKYKQNGYIPDMKETLPLNDT